MAGLAARGTGAATPFGALAGRGPITGGVATNVSNAGRGYPTSPSWTVPSTMTPQQALMYGQADINRGMQQGEQSFARSTSEQRRGWNLEDQNTALGLYGSMDFGGAGAAPPRVAGSDSSWDASLAAALGRAKDTAADAVGAARRALQGNMTARGIAGSGIEAKNERAIQLAGAGQIGAAGRVQAEQTAARQAAVNDRNYSGDIQQRGQDIGLQSSAMGNRTALAGSLMGLLRQAY